jgi:hypothetical protein
MFVTFCFVTLSARDERRFADPKKGEMAILFDAPKKSGAWQARAMRFFHSCQRLNEPITDRLLHGASAYEADEFSEVDLNVFFPGYKGPWEVSPITRRKARFYTVDVLDYILHKSSEQ